MGGHKAFAQKFNTGVLEYNDCIELTALDTTIYYNQIVDIANEDEEKIRKRRIVALGLVFLPLASVGLVWKKKFHYTVIEYNDGIDLRTNMFK
jgi:hypothetical protein